jgi:hypothetical protein
MVANVSDEESIFKMEVPCDSMGCHIVYCGMYQRFGGVDYLLLQDRSTSGFVGYDSV